VVRKFEGKQFLPKNSKESYLTICFIFHNYFMRQRWLRYDARLTSKLKHDFNHRTKLAGKGRAQGFLRRNTKLSVKNPETNIAKYRGADKSLARPTSRYILFDGESISFEARLVIYINSTNIPPIMIINRIYENQNLLLL
jgi:hypothetical protein